MIVNDAEYSRVHKLVIFCFPERYMMIIKSNKRNVIWTEHSLNTHYWWWSKRHRRRRKKQQKNVFFFISLHNDLIAHLISNKFHRFFLLFVVVYGWIESGKINQAKQWCYCFFFGSLEKPYILCEWVILVDSNVYFDKQKQNKKYSKNIITILTFDGRFG